MSIRHLNYTGRKRILREDAKIFVHPDGAGTLAFDATINLVDYELPRDARVFVEAYRQTTLMRFEHGTVAMPQPPPALSLRLTEFPTKDGLLFRVKVTSTSGRPGVLLAEADRVPISDDEEQPDNRISLLPPKGEDLGQETWRIDFTGDDNPSLLINNQLDDWKAVAASPMFRSLVYPAAMRAVLWHVYHDEVNDLDDDSDWRCRWLRFAATLPGVGDPPSAKDDESEWTIWIDSAVESFSRRHQFLDHFRALLADEATA